MDTILVLMNDAQRFWWSREVNSRQSTLRTTDVSTIFTSFRIRSCPGDKDTLSYCIIEHHGSILFYFIIIFYYP